MVKCDTKQQTLSSPVCMEEYVVHFRMVDVHYYNESQA